MASRARATVLVVLTAFVAGGLAAAAAACNALIGVKDYETTSTVDAGTNVQMDSGAPPDATMTGSDAANEGDGGEASDAAGMPDGDASVAPPDFDASCDPTSYCAMILDAGPLAYFRFNELGTDTETDADVSPYDWSGHGVTLGLDGSVGVTSGAPVDTNGFALQVGDTAAADGGTYMFRGLATPNPPFTVEAWFFANPAAQVVGGNTLTQIPFRIPAAATTAGARMLLGSSSVRALFEVTISGEVAGTSPSSAPLPASQFTHVAGTFDGTSAQIFVAGFPGTASKVAEHEAFTTDGRLSSSPLYGAIDEIAVYGRVLSVGEILAHASFTPP